MVNDGDPCHPCPGRSHHSNKTTKGSEAHMQDPLEVTNNLQQGRRKLEKLCAFEQGYVLLPHRSQRRPTPKVLGPLPLQRFCRRRWGAAKGKIVKKLKKSSEIGIWPHDLESPSIGCVGKGSSFCILVQGCRTCVDGLLQHIANCIRQVCTRVHSWYLVWCLWGWQNVAFQV